MNKNLKREMTVSLKISMILYRMRERVIDRLEGQQIRRKGMERRDS